jgi:hypothetical protein
VTGDDDVHDDAPDEDLIESETPSTRANEFRRRLEVLVPATVGRKVLGGIAVGALALGLVAGFLLGNLRQPEPAEITADVQPAPALDGGYGPIAPDGSPVEEAVVVLAMAGGLLTLQDLAGLGESALPRAFRPEDTAEADQFCGLSTGAGSLEVPPGPGATYGVANGVSFILGGASLTERIGADLDVLAASTLRARVELALNCSRIDGPAVRTDGIQTGIGDEYAVFMASRPDPASGAIQSSIVVVVRVGGHLIELTLTSQDGEPPDAQARALRIAEVAVARMLSR